MTGPPSLWAQLGSFVPELPGMMAQRLKEITACKVFVALELPRGNRALVIEVPSIAIPIRFKLPQARGLAARIEVLSKGEYGTSRLVITAATTDHHELFAALANDILPGLVASSTAREAVTVLLARLDRWKRFFDNPPAEKLGLDSLKGLWGELRVMESHLATEDALTVVAAWVGPSKANHDFEYPTQSVEVKTTAAGPPITIGISNCLQLEQTAAKPLYLELLETDVIPAGGESVPDVVDRVRSLIDIGEAAALFEERLSLAGYLDAYRSDYDTIRFSLRARYRFAVADGFPRIRPASIPAGVGDVRYCIELSACLPFRIDL